MTKLNGWIKRHQVSAFFVIAFMISWAIWLLSPVLSGGDEDTKMVVTLIGAYGPALAAMLVSGMVSPEPAGIPSARRWLVFILVFSIADLIWFLSTEKFGPFDLSNPVLFGSKQVLAACVAIVISGIFSSRKGVHDLLLPLTNWRVGFVWYLIVILGLPLVIVLAIFFAVLLNAPLPAGSDFVQPQPWSQLIPGLLLAYLQTLLFQGPLNEEPGWRGLALPRLQTTYGSIAASIVIGVVWGLWHAPLYFTGVYSGGIESMMGRLLWTIPLAFLFTWIYNRTHGSLLMTVLLHTSVNLQGDITLVVLQALQG